MVASTGVIGVLLDASKIEAVAAEVGSLSASAEALRLTAAAPQRNNNAGGDYEG